MSRAHEGLPPDSPGDVRALPARPNLEFERKQAKKLLAQLRKGDFDALARVHAKHRASVGKPPDEFQLSDAQFTIAREYGFTSWPRLVEYFSKLARHEVSGQRAPYAHESIENSPKWDCAPPQTSCRGRLPRSRDSYRGSTGGQPAADMPSSGNTVP